MRFILGTVMVLVAGILFAQEATGPQQPVAFSHKKHVGLGLACKECHANADPGESMGLPATSKCMACHFSIAKDKPAIQKLKSFADAKQPVPWVRVYQIPSYVEFNHRTHTEAGAKCDTCHGAVSERDVLFKEKSLSMGFCMDCHRANQASVDCNFCHDPR